MTGSLQVRDYPGEVVRLSCDKCCGRYDPRRATTPPEWWPTKFSSFPITISFVGCSAHSHFLFFSAAPKIQA